MNLKLIFVFLVLGAMVLSLTGVFYENHLLEQAGNLLIIFPLVGYYFRELPVRNLNFSGFLVCFLLAGTLTFFSEIWYFNYVAHGFWMACFVFLSREAIHTTEYRRGKGFILLYFLLIVAIYGYLLSLHIVEIEASLSNTFLFAMYLIYYINLMFLAVTALIYYLNSFSRKSVFFICLTLSFIVSDVLRDMGVFYFRDLSVEIVGTLIKFAALKLVFLFFVTKEKKLRLLNLI